MPSTTTGPSRTRLMRFLLASGTCRLVVLPAPTLNCENELKAFWPAIVLVVTLVTLPFVVTVVAVRPSIMI